MIKPPHIPVLGGRPKHQKQLPTGHPLAGTNCGPTVELVSLGYTSNNQIRPRGAARAKWITAIRAPMVRSSSWPSTTLRNIVESVTSKLIAQRFRTRKEKPPTARFVRVTHDQAVKLLKRGFFLYTAIDYGRLNKLMPRLSGDSDFRGGHAIGLLGYADDRNGKWTWLEDPLHDGRRPGIPKGWQKVRIKRYLRAAESWGVPKAGPGRAYVVIIGKGK